MANFSRLIKENPNILDLLKLDGSTKKSPEEQFLARPEEQLIGQPQEVQNSIARPEYSFEDIQRNNILDESIIDENKRAELEQKRKMENRNKQRDVISKIKQQEAVEKVRDIDPDNTNSLRNIDQKIAVDKIRQENNELKNFEDQYEKESQEADVQSEETQDIQQQNKPLTLMEQYKNLQQKQLDSARDAQYAKASNMILQGLLDRADPKIFENQRKMIDDSLAIPELELKQFTDQIGMQSQDPESDYSRMVRNYIQEKSGVELGGLSAAQIEKSPILKVYAQEAKAKALSDFKERELMDRDRRFQESEERKMQVHLDNLKAKKDRDRIFEEMAKNKSGQAGERLGIAKDREQRVINKDFGTYVKPIEEQLGRAKNISHIIDAIEETRHIKDPSKRILATRTLREELANGLTTIFTGKPATVSGTEHAKVNNLHSKIADMKSYVTSLPTDTISRGELLQLKKDLDILKSGYLELYDTRYNSFTKGLGKSIDRYGEGLKARKESFVNDTSGNQHTVESNTQRDADDALTAELKKRGLD